MYHGIKLEMYTKYSNIYEINQIDPAIRIKMKRDISYTYDNFCIVSEKFKAFCQNEKYVGLEFVLLPQSPGFYWFKVNTILEYNIDAKGRLFINYDSLYEAPNIDLKERRIKFINYNEQYDGYEEIIGAHPVCLKTQTPLPDGFFRTDLCFGSYATKHPLYIVGEITRKKLKQAGFKEIDFDKILNEYDWQKKQVS